MKTIKDLRNELATAFAELRSGAIDTKVMAELNNTSGKIVSTLKIELEYAAACKREPRIDFLGGAMQTIEEVKPAPALAHAPAQ